MLPHMLLRVNLTSMKIRVEEIDDALFKKYLGGKLLGYHLAAMEIPPCADPLSEVNKLIFAPGLLSGFAPGASKVAVVSKSPETGLINDSYAGDRFGPYLRRWGYSAVVVEGKAPHPVYLKVGKDAEIHDAFHLWGRGVYETTELIWREHGDGAVAAIGPAGENRVRIANIMFDGERSAGRGGLGAVMGSKNLKAVFVEPRELNIGSLSQSDEIKGLFKKIKEYFDLSSPPSLKVYGTTNGLLTSSRRGMSPAYNFSRPYIPENLAKRLAGDEIKKYEVTPEHYIHGSSCPVKCARYVEVMYRGVKFRVKPEYESIAMLGAATGVFEFPAVAYFIRLANDYGLDAIATGNVIAWLFEAVEKKIINPKQWAMSINGFGDSDAEELLINLIAHRRGIGSILAEGVKRATQILNLGHEFAVHVKGLEAPAWDPRGLRTYGLSYATADIGASHLRGWPNISGFPNDGPASEGVKSMIENRDADAIRDTLGLCKFLGAEIPDEIYRLAGIYTGLSKDDAKVYLKRGAWMAENISRIYAILSGMIPREEDKIPPRWWEPEEEGPAKGNAAFIDLRDFEEARKLFYKLRGWDERGIPKKETLLELGMEEYIPLLERLVN